MHVPRDTRYTTPLSNNQTCHKEEDTIGGSTSEEAEVEDRAVEEAEIEEEEEEGEEEDTMDSMPRRDGTATASPQTIQAQLSAFALRGPSKTLPTF